MTDADIARWLTVWGARKVGGATARSTASPSANPQLLSWVPALDHGAAVPHEGRPSAEAPAGQWPGGSCDVFRMTGR